MSLSNVSTKATTTRQPLKRTFAFVWCPPTGSNTRSLKRSSSFMDLSSFRPEELDTSEIRAQKLRRVIPPTTDENDHYKLEVDPAADGYIDERGYFIPKHREIQPKKSALKGMGASLPKSKVKQTIARAKIAEPADIESWRLRSRKGKHRSKKVGRLQHSLEQRILYRKVLLANPDQRERAAEKDRAAAALAAAQCALEVKPETPEVVAPSSFSFTFHIAAAFVSLVNPASA